MNIIIVGEENNIPFVVSDLKEEANINIVNVKSKSTNIKYELEKINIKDLDYIVVAIRNIVLKNIVTESILNYQYCLKEIIIDYYGIVTAMMKPQVVDRVLSNPKYSSFDTLILGISHAEVGIVPERLLTATANIAASSQDIYYNYASLLHCIKNYPQKIVSIKHVIIDMFDYTYFNFDTSLTKRAYEYIVCNGGIQQPHNYDKNKNFNISFDNLLEYEKIIRYKGIDVGQIDKWETIFGKLLGDPEYYIYRNRPFIESIVETYDPDNDNYIQVINSSIANNVFEETLLENSELFKMLLDLIYAINPKMDVKLIVMPNYKHKTEEDCNMQRWKGYFYNRIEEYKTLYPVEFFDFKYCELSNDPSLFYNTDHLNYNGACKFTDMLNDIIYM